MNSALNEYLDCAGAGAVLMVSPAARRDILKNTSPLDWHLRGSRQTYRGALVELHDEWSWGWMVRKANGEYVELASVTVMCDACDGSGFGVAETYCGKCSGAGGYPASVDRAETCNRLRL